MKVCSVNLSNTKVVDWKGFIQLSIKKNDEGTYDVRISYKSNKTKSGYATKSKYGFVREKDAKAWEARMVAKLNRGADFSENPALADYFLKWYKVYKEPMLARTTKKNYIATHTKLKKYFGNDPIKSITRMDYQGFLNECGSKLAKSTVNKTHKHVRACVQEALQNDIIPKDFTHKATVTGKKRH